jgi:choline dehydrogenase-like flavoprotein
MHPYNKFGYNWTDTLSAQASTSAARAAGDDAAGAFGRAAHADRRYAVISLEIANNHPVSVGSVSLRSADPFAPPLIDPPYLKDEADVAYARNASRVRCCDHAAYASTHSCCGRGFVVETAPA